MIPVMFKGVTKTLHPSYDWDAIEYGICDDLPIQFENGICKSCWKLSFIEIFKLFFSRKIYLSILTGPIGTQSPVMLSVDK